MMKLGPKLTVKLKWKLTHQIGEEMQIQYSKVIGHMAKILYTIIESQAS